ncbi:MAG: DNA-formamidopyrimidine glycosylase family protein [Verrucomicrobiota bacterium]
MPELAEVEYYRKKWDPGIGETIQHILVNHNSAVFKKFKALPSLNSLVGKKLISSQCHGKQMLFILSKGTWLSIHLGMTGNLRAANLEEPREKHDHLVLLLEKRSLIFSDPRTFGQIKWGSQSNSNGIPTWWQDLPPTILSEDFNLERLVIATKRHKKCNVKALLLKQEYFPGIGNWMADEILWQTKIHPKRLSMQLTKQELHDILKKCRSISRVAMRIIGTNWGDLPNDWLFNHRWKDGGRCPIDGTPLIREKISGRTTCYCPFCQNR